MHSIKTWTTINILLLRKKGIHGLNLCQSQLNLVTITIGQMLKKFQSVHLLNNAVIF